MEIGPVAVDALDELEPVWAALGEHHATIAPAFLPERRERAASWARRRADYRTWLASGGFGLAAREGSAVVGYVMVRFDDIASVTWQLEGRLAEIETLAVLPAYRGAGLGRALLDAARAQAAACGAAYAGLQVVAGNEDALRFYAREGLNPIVLRLLGPVERP
jgi:ribosomal protein S18 acetylase RimI-like enzyme